MTQQKLSCQAKTIWLDLEVCPKTKQLLVGAVLCDDHSMLFSGSDLQALLLCVEQAAAIGGHHVLGFDLVELGRLAQQPERVSAWQAKAVDTLLLSSLLLPHRPSHRLAKLYRANQTHNDPVLDCQESRELYQRCQQQWQQLPLAVRHFFSLALPLPAELQVEHVSVDYLSELRLLLPVGQVAELWDYLLGLPTRTWGNLGACCFLSWLFYFDKPIARRPVWLADYSDHRQTFIEAERIFWRDKTFSMTQINQECHLFFGYALRDGQRDIVDAVMQQRDVPLGILPTGGGKSLTFQLPALILSKYYRGLTVIVSPLKALMEDQVLSLQQRLPDWGNRVACMISGQSEAEQARILEGVWEGAIDILYISPERLRSRTMAQLLRHRRPAFWVIDEAHTLSQWGADFRPDFMRIAQTIQQCYPDEQAFESPRLLMVTATASVKVKEDLQREVVASLRVLGGKVLTVYGQQQKIWRDEVQAECRVVRGQERLTHIQQILQQLPQTDDPAGVALVYVRSRRKTEEYAQYLAQQGLRCAPYHSKMSATDKKRVLQRFKQHELDVVVCTNAFGMGIDRAGIHTVIHSGPPNSLESYMQEIGRAARQTGETGQAILLWDDRDIARLFEQDRQGRIRGHKALHECWKLIKPLLNRPESDRWFPAQLLARVLDVEPELLPTQIRVVLLALERYQLLIERDQVPALISIKLEANAPASTEGQISTLYQQLKQVLASGEATELYLPELAQVLGYRVRALIQQVRQLVSAGYARWQCQVSIRAVDAHPKLRNHFKRQELALHALSHCLSAQTADLFAADEAQVYRVDTRAVDLWLQQHQQGCSMREHILPLLRVLQQIKYRKQRHVFQIESVVEGAGWTDWLSAAFVQLKRLQQLLTVVLQTLDDQKDRPVHTFDLHQLAVDVDQMPEDVLQQLDQLQDLQLLDVSRLDDAQQSLFFVDAPKRAKPFRQVAYRYLQEHYLDRNRRLHVLKHWLTLPNEQQKDLIEAYFTLPLDQVCQRFLPDQALADLPWPINYQARIFPKYLSELQRNIIQEQHRAVMILAGPGSGKTTVIVHRVANLVALQEIDPKRVLVLAYNRMAVFELRHRLRQLLGDLATDIDVYTFHALARKITNKTERDAPILDEKSEFKWLIQQATQSLKDQPSQYQYVLVDEFQDVDDDQYALIAQLAGLEAGEGLHDTFDQQGYLMVVGDDDQNLYGFRGSSIKYIQSFELEYQIDVQQKYYLIDNYRSCSAIVAVANAFIQQAIPAHQRLKQATHCGSSTQLITGEVAYGYFQQAEGLDAATWIVEQLIAAQQQGHDLNQVAILAGRWRQLETLQHVLTAHQMPYRLANDSDHSMLPIDSWIGQQLLSELAQHEPFEQIEVDVAKWLEEWRITRQFNGHDLAWQAFLQRVQGQKSISVEALTYLIQTTKYHEPCGVTLSTYHSAKGTEYDKVFILDWAESPTPDEARYRALYVALTRARQRLTVLFAPQYHEVLLDVLVSQKAMTLDVPQVTLPPQLRFERFLTKKEVYLTSRCVASEEGREKIKTLAHHLNPFTLVQAVGGKGFETKKRSFLVEFSKTFTQDLKRKAFSVEYLGFTLMKFDQIDLSYYRRVGYIGDERSHYVFLPYVRFCRAVVTDE